MFFAFAPSNFNYFKNKLILNNICFVIAVKRV